MYDLLQGIRVLDVSLLAPSMLGAQLADLGADVLKIEAPPRGDHSRLVGGPFKNGPSLTHLRWNHGKKSVALDLKTAPGREIFLKLAAKSQVVIEGLRAGTMERFGVGYATVREINRRIVYCAISGVGHTGPYRALGTHGVAFDSFAGIVPIAFRDDGSPYIGPHISTGTRLAPVYAALGIAAALVKAERTGEGSHLDVAETDAAAFAQVDDLFRYLNTGKRRAETPFKNAVRYQFYRTRDGKFVIFQPFEHKFWQNFCRAIGRPDLLSAEEGPDDTWRNALDHGDDEALRAEISRIMLTKTQAEWVDFFIKENVPGAPVHSLDEMLDDPQFQARENVYEQQHPEAGTLKMPTTPIKVTGQSFDVLPAPTVGQHTDKVLREVLGYGDGELADLRRQGVIV